MIGMSRNEVNVDCWNRRHHRTYHYNETNMIFGITDSAEKGRSARSVGMGLYFQLGLGWSCVIVMKFIASLYGISWELDSTKG